MAITLSKIQMKDSAGNINLFPRIRIQDITSFTSVVNGNVTSYVPHDVASAGKIKNAFLEINKVTTKSTAPSTTAIPTVAVVKEYVTSKVAATGGTGAQAGVKSAVFGGGLSEANGQSSGALTIVATYATSSYDPGEGVVQIATGDQLVSTTSGAAGAITAAIGNQLHEYVGIIRTVPYADNVVPNTTTNHLSEPWTLGVFSSAGSWTYTSEFGNTTALVSDCIRNVADHILYDITTSDLYYVTSSGVDNSSFERKAYVFSAVNVKYVTSTGTTQNISWNFNTSTTVGISSNAISGIKLMLTSGNGMYDNATPHELYASADNPTGNTAALGTVRTVATAASLTDTAAYAVPTVGLLSSISSTITSTAVTNAESKIVSDIYTSIFLSSLSGLAYYEEI